jgi:hypothetical protein
MAQEDDVATPSQPPSVDLRWLGVRLQRTVSYQSEPAPAVKAVDLQPPSFGQEMGLTSASTSNRSLAAINPDDASGSDASVPAQQASVNAVMDMLNSWQKAQHAAR